MAMVPREYGMSKGTTMQIVRGSKERKHERAGRKEKMSMLSSLKGMELLYGW